MKRFVKRGMAGVLVAGTVAAGASTMTAQPAAAASKVCHSAAAARRVAVRYFNNATTHEDMVLWGDYIIDLTEYMMENGC